MNEEQIKKLLDALFALQYKYKSSSGEIWESNVVARDARTEAETLIRSFLLENRDEKIGILEAKVYAYEQIIANSNFAPLLIKNNNRQTSNEKPQASNKKPKP